MESISDSDHSAGDNAEAAPPAPAGILIRLLARAIDWVFLAVVSVMITLAAVFFATLVHRFTGWNAHAFARSATQTTWIAWVGGVVGTVVYYVICEGVCGATLGKLMIGAQVIGVDGSPCRFKQALVRTISLFVDLLFFGMIGAMSAHSSPLKQRVGDHWADTYVALRKTLPDGIRSLRSQVIATTMVGVLATSVVQIATEVVQYLSGS